jgi:hypothetical protein
MDCDLEAEAEAGGQIKSSILITYCLVFSYSCSCSCNEILHYTIVKCAECSFARQQDASTVCSTKRPISEWQEYMDIKTHFKTFFVLDSCLELQKVSGG